MRVPFQMLAVGLVAFSACDGKGARGGGGSPTAPWLLAPPTPATSAINGVWAGTVTVTGVNRDDHCVVRYFDQNRGAPFTASADMNGSGSGVWVGMGTEITPKCHYYGTLTGQRLLVTARECEWFVPPPVVKCSSGRDYEINLQSGSLEGTFDEALHNLVATQRSELRAIRESETFDFVLVNSVKMAKH